MKQGDVFILESQELALLLSAKGISYFQGFPLKYIPQKREELLQTTKNLVDKGFLVSDGTSFQTEPEISACLAVLEKSSGLWLVNPESGAVPQSFLYPGDQVLIFRPLTVKQGAVKIRRILWENLGDFALEQGRRTVWQYYEKGGQKPVVELNLTLLENGMLEIKSYGAIRECQAGEFVKCLNGTFEDRQETD